MVKKYRKEIENVGAVVGEHIIGAQKTVTGRWMDARMSISLASQSLVLLFVAWGQTLEMGQRLGMSLRPFSNNNRYSQLILQNCFIKCSYTRLVALWVSGFSRSLYTSIFLYRIILMKGAFTHRSTVSSGRVRTRFTLRCYSPSPAWQLSTLSAQRVAGSTVHN